MQFSAVLPLRFQGRSLAKKRSEKPQFQNLGLLDLEPSSFVGSVLQKTALHEKGVDESIMHSWWIESFVQTKTKGHDW